MSKLFTLASVNGSSLSGANLKATLVSLWNALSAVGVTDSNRVTVTASATLLTTQCGYLPVDCSGGSITLTLPTSGTSTDEAEYRIRRIDTTYANTLTIQRGSTDTIEGGTSSITVGCLGEASFKLPGGTSNWRVTSRGGATALAARETLAVPAVNYLDNPDAEVYQRSVVATADDTYMEDRWYALTQTSTVTPFQYTAPEDGFANAMRVFQSQTTAQRFGEAQIIDGVRTNKLRSKTVTFGGRLRLSASGNLRMAILAWTGTVDTVTSDVVNDWTSSTYTGGNFFVATNLTVVAVSPSIAVTGGAAASCSVTGQIPSNATNVIVFYWTEATQAQNVTLDAWGRRLVEGSTLLEYNRRSESEELARCQRFFEKSYEVGTAPGSGTYVASVIFQQVNGTRPLVPVKFSVAKRAAPAVTIYNPNSGATGSMRSLDNLADYASAMDYATGNSGFQVRPNAGASGATAFHWAASADL